MPDINEQLHSLLAPYFGQMCRAGDSTCFVFDRASLEQWQLDMLLENNLQMVAPKITDESGSGWSEKVIPFALLGIGEDLEADEITEFDSQCDGVLFIDITNESVETAKILICTEPTSAELNVFKESFSEMSLEVI